MKSIVEFSGNCETVLAGDRYVKIPVARPMEINLSCTFSAVHKTLAKGFAKTLVVILALGVRLQAYTAKTNDWRDRTWIGIQSANGVFLDIKIFQIVNWESDV